MYILHELWRGNITPCERMIQEDSKFAKILHRNAQIEQAFCKTLTEEQQKAYDKIYGGQIEMMGIAEEESFALGYRIGVRMLLDAIGNCKSQFKLIGNASGID